MAKHINDKTSTCTKVENKLGANFIGHMYECVFCLNQQEEGKKING